jgi:hypothetical protein
MTRWTIPFGVWCQPGALVLALAAAWGTTADAGVYKCAGDRGAVIYQDAACPAGRELRDLERDPAQLSIVPGTPVPRSVGRPAEIAPRTAKIRAAASTQGGDPGERKFLRTGMTEAEVLHRVGKPDMSLNVRRKEGRQWSYLPVAGDADTLTTITFAGGTVSRVERKVVR